MTTMITKIAQAISASDGALTMDDMAREAFQQTPAGTNARTIRHARIALTTLLEPSEAMLKAADTNVWFAQDASDLATLRIMLTAMIQAALDE